MTPNGKDAPDPNGGEEKSAAGSSTGDNAIQNGTGDMPARAMHYDQLILQALRRIIRAVDIHSQKLKSTHQITGPQLICLIAIVEHGPLSIGQIAQHIHLSPSTVVGVLDRLESKGLVLRLRDTKDRRVVNVRATPSGIQIVQKAPSPLHEGLANALKNLPDIEQSTIALALERIVDLMEVRHIEATPILETGQLSSAEEGESGSLPADEPNTKRTHPSSENEGS